MGYFPEEIHSFSQKESKGRVILEFGKKYFLYLTIAPLLSRAKENLKRYVADQTKLQ